MPKSAISTPVAVLGAGSWGTALAALASHKAPTCIWARNPDSAAQIQQEHRLPAYLPKVRLPRCLTATADLHAAMQHVLADDSQPGLIILGVPMAGLVPLCQQISALLPSQRQHPLFVLRTSKGMDPHNTELPHQLTARHLPQGLDWLHTGTLSGPSFALEVAQGLPVGLTVVSSSEALTDGVVSVLHGESARIYSSTDVIGVEVGGALKNIIAIACGISDGMGFGTNARAALITRGLAEMQRLGVALGGEASTFMGLTGLGDLVLTATGDLSRNRQVGLALAEGQTLEQILASGLTAEGVRCTQAALRIAQQHQVDAPITHIICEMLFHGLSPQAAAQQLLRRPSQRE